MVFSSLLFLFFYLPVTLAVYYLCPARWRNLWLFLVNLVFYGANLANGVQQSCRTNNLL